ncbi:MAG TPA: cytochrome c oxidase assembly protein, partial [Gemmatimonadaceae bacterium]|nr:cytochrome c oxidase assembly protein [Gemmatimonadaceae bacterium]
LALLALLHPIAQIDWTRWTVHPSTVVGIAALAGLYWWAGKRDGGRGMGDELPRDPSLRSGQALPEQFIPRPASRIPSPGQRVAFFLGLTVLFLSLNGPLHDLSDSFLFSAHMVQHLLLALVVAPLLVGGTPGGMLRPVLHADRRIEAVARALTKPVTCFVLFNLVVAVWHLPPVYGLAMRFHWVHIVQHLMFLATAVLMWWPLLSPLPELPRLAYPGQMLYCFLMVIPMSIVSIYIAMADQVLYPAYASAPRIWGISPLTDQHIGGLIMWVPGGLFFYGVMTVVFFKWAQRQEDGTAAAQVDWRPAPGTAGRGWSG